MIFMKKSSVFSYTLISVDVTENLTHQNCLKILRSLIAVFIFCLLVFPVMGNLNQNSTNQSFEISKNPSFSHSQFATQQDIHNTIAENIALDNIIKNSIADREKKLSEHFLKVDDNASTRIQTKGFVVGNSSLPSGTGNIPSSTTNIESNIPDGGYIIHGSDGNTRIFSADGNQLFYVNDTESKRISTPDGGMIPSSHSLSVPSGSIIDHVGDNFHIQYKGKLLLTVSNDNSNINIIPHSPLVSSPVSINEGLVLPTTTSSQWVEYTKFSSQ